MERGKIIFYGKKILFLCDPPFGRGGFFVTAACYRRGKSSQLAEAFLPSPKGLGMSGKPL
jgi:hypothetical protein